ncbi:MAG: diguanylate cyclase [Chitinivibrionales bacterium]|nr:diguanylate cyclase [Chitinivibrionales bacterium]
MSTTKIKWGLIPFLLSPVLVFTAVLFSFRYSADPHDPLILLIRRMMPWLGVVLSIAAFFIGHLSYPRVHNLKTYLLGFLCGLAGLAYFVVNTLPRQGLRPSATETYLTALHVLVFANIILVLLVPSFVKYATTKIVTIVIAGIESMLIPALVFIPQTHRWMGFLLFDRIISAGFAAGSVLFGIVTALAVLKLSAEFHLGGIIAGMGFLYFASWNAGFLSDPATFRTSIHVLALLYLIGGTMFHWVARLEHRIAYDPLLQIYNRNYCSKIISEQSSLNTAPPFAVAMVDIDHFKKVNDTYGHRAGDMVLYNTAQTVSREIIPDGIVCRYGGEELIAFFPQKTLRQVQPLMEQVRLAVEKMKTVAKKKTIKVTLSCGISHRIEKSQRIMDVIEAADKALYRAKKGGRNQIKSGKTASTQSKKPKSE